MKTLFALLALTAIPAFAADDVAQGKPCRLEGERAYVQNAEDSRNDDVYVCESGAWNFLYTRQWDDGLNN
jgi:hypothetical protein